jgi:hypothetical protein
MALTDIASRHGWRLDPIVGRLLDTEFFVRTLPPVWSQFRRNARTPPTLR